MIATNSKTLTLKTICLDAVTKLPGDVLAAHAVGMEVVVRFPINGANGDHTTLHLQLKETASGHHVLNWFPGSKTAHFRCGRRSQYETFGEVIEAAAEWVRLQRQADAVAAQ
jgi:hypothetical protein